MTYYVYLNSKYDEYAVPDEIYAQICALVQDNKLCTYDYHDVHPYAADNPCVGKNICLRHMCQKHPHLTFVHDSFKWRNGPDDGAMAYIFLDSQGYVYLSTEDSSQQLQRSIVDTLGYYDFNAPEKVTSRGKSVDFYPSYATLYGDLKTASVIVLSYHHYSEKVKGLFLLYKVGYPKELSRKSDLYARAEALVTTKESYHREAEIYEIISQLESAMYDVTLKLKNGKQGTDNQTTGDE